jgi:FdhD protein
MMYKEIPCIRKSGDAFTTELHPVVEEVPVALFVNGRHAATVMTSPTMLKELIVGFLLTEGVIKSLDEIEALSVDNDRAEVLTKNPYKILFSKKTVLSGCGGSSSFLDMKKLPKIHSDLTVTPEQISTGLKTVLNSPLHMLTGGVHVVGLIQGDQHLAIVEDIGRHNALDRVIGYAALNRIDLSQTFVVCTGRISSEMARKCLIANIPIIVSRGATTTLAVEIARAGGLTVIGFVRSDKMNIYSGEERVSGAGSLDIPASVE